VQRQVELARAETMVAETAGGERVLQVLDSVLRLAAVRMSVLL
jgi:hypothetical protein